MMLGVDTRHIKSDVNEYYIGDMNQDITLQNRLSQKTISKDRMTQIQAG